MRGALRHVNLGTLHDVPEGYDLDATAATCFLEARSWTSTKNSGELAWLSSSVGEIDSYEIRVCLHRVRVRPPRGVQVASAGR